MEFYKIVKLSFCMIFLFQNKNGSSSMMQAILILFILEIYFLNVVPLFNSLFTSIFPPIASTWFLVIKVQFLVHLHYYEKFYTYQRVSRFFFMSIPIPLSSICKIIYSSVVMEETFIKLSLSWDLYFMLFVIKLSTV
jgi:hypothetical protein